MVNQIVSGLSRRERQIMDFLYERDHASVAEVMEGIADPPSYSAVRAMLRTLEEKGRVTHVEDGRAYVYRPTIRKDAARQGALTHLLKTFFDGSTEQAVAALLDLQGAALSKSELDRVAKLVAEARREGR
ncbi:MAG: BlaI/MecI/CopY family transcriptional regulator [Gemmatimonadales bacterium]